jgi:hydrogenase expression/formation protein HypC
MCIAVPGKVLEVSGPKARVDFFGKVLEVDSRFISVRRNDYILAFGGNVIEKIPRKRALETAKVLGGMI